MTKTSAGIFQYRASKDGWDDYFRIVDDDGMSFVLDGFKEFEGRWVKITVETYPDEDSEP